VIIKLINKTNPRIYKTMNIKRINEIIETVIKQKDGTDQSQFHLLNIL